MPKKLSVVLFRSLCPAVALLGLAVPAAAGAHESAPGNGATAAAQRPAVAQAVCGDAAAWVCSRGARLTLQGESLSDVRQVRFVGGRGKKDDRVARPQRSAPHIVEVLVPRAARSGPIAVMSSHGGKVTTAKPLRVRSAAPVAPEPVQPPATSPLPGSGTFPVAGTHDYGAETNRFGGGRGHGGQDVFAACGTPLVAVFAATVQFAATQDRAGNYLVLQTSDGSSYAYMHMQAPADVKKGDLVTAGQPVGRVGDTGRASGCHVHFEQWTAPGWYEGGKAIDPLPLLQSLDG